MAAGITKICGHCKLEKSVLDFHKACNTWDGRHSICKPCRIEYNLPRVKQWRLENYERRRAYERMRGEKKRLKKLRQEASDGAQ